jgi:citrate lyase subunit beta/citryl-CoA lyase
MTDEPAKIELPRSLMFVPANEQRKLAKAQTLGADALIIDLEDSVPPDAKAAARQKARQFLAAHIWNKRRPRLYVRINNLEIQPPSTGIDVPVM